MQIPAQLWQEGTISQNDCQRIIDCGKEKWKSGGVRNENESSHFRKSNVIWLEKQWIFDLIWPYMQEANEIAGWKYEIASPENCQLTRYQKGGYYNWHEDGLGSHKEKWNKPDEPRYHENVRKLSMTILLNSDFKGGDFEIHGVNEMPKMGRGSIIVFPSFKTHRVSRITKGTRYSLVAWFVGPPFV